MLVFYGQIHFQDIIKLEVCASVKPMSQTYTYQPPIKEYVYNFFSF
uniref:Uncharacterized protein n=1 Tax=Rhizophora mucronata TaxID=61149 RepID=A0A2P2LVG8_RHIMU